MGFVDYCSTSPPYYKAFVLEHSVRYLLAATQKENITKRIWHIEST